MHDIYQCPVTHDRLDPLRVLRQLRLLSGDQINAWIVAQRGEDELKSLEAEERIIPVVRTVFHMPTAEDEPGGYTDRQCLEALNGFLEYLRGKEQRGQHSQPRSPCSVCPPG